MYLCLCVSLNHLGINLCIKLLCICVAGCVSICPLVRYVRMHLSQEMPVDSYFKVPALASGSPFRLAHLFFCYVPIILGALPHFLA